MRKLNEIAADLQGVLTEYFRSVRISAGKTPEQLLKEIKAINPEKLPGVVIAFDSLKFDGMNMTNTGRMTLVLIDQFRSGSDERALSLFQAGSSLMTLFPADGKEINGVWYYPRDCVSVTPDPQFAALAIGLDVKQGSV